MGRLERGFWLTVVAVSAVALSGALTLGCQTPDDFGAESPTTSKGPVEKHTPQELTGITCNDPICPAPLPYTWWACTNAWGACTCTPGSTCVDTLPDCDWSHTPAPNEAYLGFHTEGDPMNVQCKLIYQPNDPNSQWKDFMLPRLAAIHGDSPQIYLYKIKTGTNFYGYLYPGEYYTGNGCIVWAGYISGVDPSHNWTTDNACSGIFATDHISSIHFYKWNSSINP